MKKPKTIGNKVVVVVCLKKLYLKTNMHKKKTAIDTPPGGMFIVMKNRLNPMKK